jgi:hypothetical protein
VTTEDQPATGFAARMAFALEKDPSDEVRRTNVNLWLIVITLAWAVVVPILVVYGLSGRQRGSSVFTLAAFAVLLGPFAAAVLATRSQRFGLAGVYIVVTLLMIFPALAVLRL